MAWKKNGRAVALSLMFILAACGDDSQSGTNETGNVVREAPTIDDLGTCSPERDGDTVYVVHDDVEYLCVNEKWVNIDSVFDGAFIFSSSSILTNDVSSAASSSSIDSAIIDYPLSGPLGDTVNSKEDLSICVDTMNGDSVYVRDLSIYFSCDGIKWIPENTKGYIKRDYSISGNAVKGPFKAGSPISLREFRIYKDTIRYSGNRYDAKIFSNKGDFSISKLNMVFPYAEISVRGLWKNEITGDYSKDSLSLRSFVNLSTDSEININLLTHLEAERVSYLINKGYDFSKAKQQAHRELISAFGFTTSIAKAETLKMFVNSDDELYDENAMLLALSNLFVGNLTDSEIYYRIEKFSKNFAMSGVWNDDSIKAKIADWTESFDNSTIRDNLERVNLSDIPNYERYMALYWYNIFGLDSCTKEKNKSVKANSNPLSQKYGAYYTCQDKVWRKSTDLEKDTFGWNAGNEGDVKVGDVTSTYYIYENGEWIVAKNENVLGECVEKRKGEIGRIDSLFLICKDRKWEPATNLEYDTYGWDAGNEGEVRVGKINADKYYVYENGSWRLAANEVEEHIGACVLNREGDKGSVNGKYYVCTNKEWDDVSLVVYNLGYCTSANVGVVEKSEQTFYVCRSDKWEVATNLEYDTYGWDAGNEGEVRVGKVNADKYYVYENGSWRLAANEVEEHIGACVLNREGDKGSVNGKYYVCTNKEWDDVSLVVYNLGYCTSANVGVVEKSEQTFYVCRSDKWEVATNLEYDTYGWDAGNEGEVRVGKVNADKYYVYENGSWRPAANEAEEHIGACVLNREGDKGSVNGKYYVCYSEKWNEVTLAFYSFGECSIIRNEEKDSIDHRYFICENENWNEITSVVYNLGYCNSMNEDVVDASDGVYYICRSNNWDVATPLEYDTYGWGTWTEGNTRPGNVNTDRYYVYVNGIWRATLNEVEDSLGACLAKREGVKRIVNNKYYICRSNNWTQLSYVEYYSGTMTDPRDGNVYKTIVIGSKTWMAENLNYADSATYKALQGNNWCFDNKCSKYGRLYSWEISKNICPSGWHLPDTTEIRNLLDSVGGWLSAGKNLNQNQVGRLMDGREMERMHMVLMLLLQDIGILMEPMMRMEDLIIVSMLQDIKPVFGFRLQM